MISKIKSKDAKIIILMIVLVAVSLTACVPNFDFLKSEPIEGVEDKVKKSDTETETSEETTEESTEETTKKEEPIDVDDIFIDSKTKLFAKHIKLDKDAKYATYSVINSGHAILYRPNLYYIDKDRSTKSDIVKIRKRIGYTPTVTINAGHGTENGAIKKTFSHPDFSPKVAGGTTSEGEVLSVAVSLGTVLDNGMKEADANLLIACRLKDMLLDEGYRVLMIRESSDVQLDNVARTVIANENSDIHIAIHFDSTDRDKGIFYIIPKKVKSYLEMEPLKSNIDGIKQLGDSMVNTFSEMGLKIFGKNGTMEGDLTQLSYSTIPSIDIELGDKKTNVDEKSIEIFADGLRRGINAYFEEK